MMDWDMGWEPTRRRKRDDAASRAPALGTAARRRDMAAQIGAELRAVFAPVPMSKLSGADDLFARIDLLGTSDIG